MLDIDTRLSFKLKTCISSVRSPLATTLSHVRAYSRSTRRLRYPHVSKKQPIKQNILYPSIAHETEVKKKKERETKVFMIAWRHESDSQGCNEGLPCSLRGHPTSRPICSFRGKLKILYSTGVTVRHYY